MNEDSYKLLASIPAIHIAHTFILEKDRRYLLGSAEMEPDMLVFAHDRSLSRRQAWLEIIDNLLHVERHPKASQSLNGDPAVKTIQIKSGETFAAGLTTFKFIVAQETISQLAPDHTYTLSARDFSSILREHNTRHFLEVVSAMPTLMQQNETPADFLFALCDTLQTRVPGLKVSAWRVQWRDDAPQSLLLQRPSSIDGAKDEFAPSVPSRHLLKQAFSSSDGDAVVSFWNRCAEDTGKDMSTFLSGTEWAMCIPIALFEDEHFALYATGSYQLPGSERREEQQVLAAIGAIAKQHLLAARAKERQGQIGQFFSPALRSILFGEIAEADQLLQPGEYEATICFFDLRGSSRVAEEVSLGGQTAIAKHFAHLESILGEATDVIFETGGIVIDFQGDAILACWGVPPSTAPQNPILQASQAAQQIVDLMTDHDWPIGESNLRCGIGITSGKVLAGLFTARGPERTLLSKYTVIGPPVNNAARLESMTKKFGVPILIDDEVAAALRGQNIPLRRIAAVRPAGMSRIINIHELVLPKAAGGTGVTPTGMQAYETALAFFEKGCFEAAAEAMRQVPHDQIELFLSEQITGMRRQGAPKEWDGVISLLSK